MKVESVKIKNFKAIADESVLIKGNNVYVIGKNAAGKTSFIDAIFKTITGKDMPQKIVRDGARNGSVEIDMGEFFVYLNFNSKSEKGVLTIESKDGAKYKAPREMLQDLAGVVDFNINDFFNLTPAKQVEFIKKLINVDFTDLDAEFKKHSEERTFQTKKVKELEAQQDFFDKNLTMDKVDILALQMQISEAEKANNQCKTVADRYSERAATIVKMEKEIESLKELQVSAYSWLEDNLPVDTSELQKQFEEATKVNDKIEANNKARIKHDELYLATTKLEELKNNLESIDEMKRRIISEAKMPVPGLTFDLDQLYYNGLPLDRSQINTAQLIIIGLQINLALLKDIKIARFDGSLLDNDNMAVVEAWAKENDLQLFVELVDRNAEALKIEVHEGAEEAQPVEA